MFTFIRKGKTKKQAVKPSAVESCPFRVSIYCSGLSGRDLWCVLALGSRITSPRSLPGGRKLVRVWKGRRKENKNNKKTIWGA